jgi:hypothetical protein
MMESKREYIEEISARLKELDSEISKLEKMADKAIEDVKAEYHRQIKDLFLKKARVQDQVDKLEKASGNAWDDMKAGTELSWEVFENSVGIPKKKKIKHIPRAIK